MNVYGQLIKAALEKLAANPTGTSAVEGVIYYNTASKEVKVHNATVFKTIVDTDTIQTLSNKEHDVATMVQQSTPGVSPAAGKTKLYLKNDKRLFMLTETGLEKVVGDEQDIATLNNQGSTPSTPSAGKVKVYSKSDKKLYKVNDAGLEQLVGNDQTVLDFTDQVTAPTAPSSGISKVYVKNSGLKLMTSDGLERTIGQEAGQGNINYILNGKAEFNTTGWANYNDAAAVPVDGTGGSSALTFTRSTVTPLRETASFLLSRTVASLGSGISFDFTIDEADKGKVLQGLFEYKVASGTYVDDGLQVWIYYIDGASSRLIQPTPYLIKTSGIVERFPFEFQAQGGASATATYRLIIHCSNATATPFSMQFDNFSVGPQSKSYGSAVTDWISYTPTGTWVSGAAYTSKWRKVGDSIEVEALVTMSGAVTGNFTLNLPSGLAIDVSKLPGGSISSLEALGIATIYKNATSTAYVGMVCLDTAYAIRIRLDNSSAIVNATSPATFASGDYVGLTFKVPIVGWSSSQVMSSDADTRLVLFTGNKTVNEAITASVTNISFTAIKDTHGGWNGTSYTVPFAGDYLLDGVININTGVPQISAYLNAGVIKLMGTIDGAHAVVVFYFCLEEEP